MRAITERSALDLAAAMRNRELSSVEVVDAHIARLTALGPKINAIAAERFEDARRDAENADRERAEASIRDATPALPPLLGVPFTVKETIAVRGMPISAGVFSRRENRAANNAPTVQRLIEAGAIPVGVTNTSEMTLWIESDNRLYGRTNNPYDHARSAGGSSGGEGAAVGSGGSPFGLASDIAGSIRIPAFFCGVFGHKPSAGLVPNTGLWPPSTGLSGRLLGTGPLARRAEDLMPLLRIIAGPDGVDPMTEIAELGDPAAVSLDGMTITTIEKSSWLPVSSELREARERAVGALIAAGAKVRRVELRSWRKALLPYMASLQAAAATETASGTATLLSESGEPEPTWRSLLRGGDRHTVPTRLALALEMLPEPSDSPRRERLLSAGDDLVAELLDAIGDGVVLHPAHPRVAPRHGRTVGRPWLLTPAAMFNLAGVPVTEVPLGLGERGLPLGVQVAASPGADHVSIAVALELERVFGGWVPPSI